MLTSIFLKKVYSFFILAFIFTFLFNARNNLNFDLSKKQYLSKKDSTLFITLVQYVHSVGLHFNRPEDFKRLQIDPHVVKASYNCCKHIPDFVHKKDLGSISLEKLAKRKRILKEYDIPVTNALRDQECIFSGGLPEPPDPDHPNKKISSSYPKRCEKQGFFLTVFFSEPKIIAGKDYVKSKNKDQSKNIDSKCWRVFAFEYTSYSRFIFALYLVKDSNLGWKIVRKKRLYGIFS